MKSKLAITTLTDQVEESIIEYIRANNLTPGDPLPNEKEFVEMFSVGRNVVREALSRLRMLGIIESRTKRGIIVKEPPLLNGFKKVLDPQLLSVPSIKELMGMRIALEVGIAEFLFTNVTAKDVAELEQIISRQQAIGVNNLSIEDEMQFHKKIYEVAGNDFILHFYELMQPVFVFAKHNYESYFEPINKKLQESDGVVTHSDLLQTIKDGDKNLYQEKIRRHLRPYWEFFYNY
ncbi:FadR/GntR family transcriptional regulator [uncultured Kriegella sp.]|uniref:FadR/GntR family transcriptional regulator n=1 Tax=uncultured Kriegella sp. TaxID=1798910 RepID=UPI0030DA6580|tara:strand:+ start:4157 stop:4858 length:702 start_codon:yes stop_codon:yes gene_type:complete